jgi:hypothetical protein
VVTDVLGNAYIAGRTTSALDSFYVYGAGDFFVTKWDSAGDAKWTRQRGTSSADSANAIAIDPFFNDLFVVGRTGGVFGDAHFGQDDIAAMKVYSSGVVEWKKQWGLTYDDSGLGVVIDSMGAVYIAGGTSNALDGLPYNGGISDAFVMRVLPDW